MLFRRILLILYGLFYTTLSLYPCDYRQMGRQTHRQNMKRERFQNPQTEKFAFTPSFKAHTVQGQLILGLLFASAFVTMVEASQPNSPFISSDPCLDQATASALSTLFCQNNPCIEVSNNTVFFNGNHEETEKFVEKYNNFSKLRETLIPPSPAAAKTQVHSFPYFSNFYDVLSSLGIPAKTFENIAFSEGSTLDGTKRFISIDYSGPKGQKKSFNQKIADSFIETLKEESLFFHFLVRSNPKIITYKKECILINYSLLNDYLCLIQPQEILIDQNFRVSLPVDNILKRLMAVVSGPISLEQSTVNSNNFHVRTVTVENPFTTYDEQSPPPSINFVIDTSGSMEGENIYIINKNVPTLIKNIKSHLKTGNDLRVNLYSLNHKFFLSESFILSDSSDIPSWKTMKADGGTDLRPIGNLLDIKKGESDHKIVVAFTDGEHDTPSQLNDAYYKSLRDLQSSGHFSQLFLCKVGKGSDQYFQSISNIFSGSYFKEEDIPSCIKRIEMAIPSLLLPKTPLVLTINGQNKVIWQNNNQHSISTTIETVKSGDSLVFGEFKTLIDPVFSETKQEKIARLKAQQDKLAAELAALDDYNNIV